MEPSDPLNNCPPVKPFPGWRCFHASSNSWPIQSFRAIVRLSRGLVGVNRGFHLSSGCAGTDRLVGSIPRPQFLAAHQST